MNIFNDLFFEVEKANEKRLSLPRTKCLCIHIKTPSKQWIVTKYKFSQQGSQTWTRKETKSSEIECLYCGVLWRTTAKYVETIKNNTEEEITNRKIHPEKIGIWKELLDEQIRKGIRLESGHFTKEHKQKFTNWD